MVSYASTWFLATIVRSGRDVDLVLQELPRGVAEHAFFIAEAEIFGL